MGMKWPYFVNRPMTTKIVDFPWDLGKASTKSTETLAQTFVGLGSGFKSPEGMVVSVLCL
jgi:hypothetical protein